uniref:YHYH domain-containing protein n=1 Tax=Ciona savignyi TaxID=51511 RepID=H2YGJ4_CIOSA
MKMLLNIALLLLVTQTCQGLTTDELNQLYDMNGPNSPLNISILSYYSYQIRITGMPSHVTSDCYNVSATCCRPNATPRPSPKMIVIPRIPTYSSDAISYCTPMGLIGVTIDGTAIYNHLESGCVDVNFMPDGSFDECNGHPSPTGEYHFHRAPKPSCLGVPNDEQPHMIGVALDGFAIYDSDTYNGVRQTLDECGGFKPDGDATKYRYVSLYTGTTGTDHVINCLKGIPVQPKCCTCLECGRQQLPDCVARRGGSGGPGGYPGRPGGYPSRPGRYPGGPRPSTSPGQQNCEMPGSNFQQLDCNTCRQQTCVPTGGYRSMSDGLKYAECKRRCRRSYNYQSILCRFFGRC